MGFAIVKNHDCVDDDDDDDDDDDGIRVRTPANEQSLLGRIYQTRQTNATEPKPKRRLQLSTPSFVLYFVLVPTVNQTKIPFQ